jgi:autotransporter-associated beta strand protein
MKKNMQKIILTLFTAISLTPVVSAQTITLASYDIPTSTASISSVAGTAASGVTAGSITIGSGLTLSSSSGGWRGTAFNQVGQDATALAAANSGGDYWAFSMSAQANYSVTLNGFGSVGFVGSSTGPKNWALLYSTSSDFSSPTTVVASTITPSSTAVMTTTAWSAALTATPISITAGNTAYFRIVGYGASGTSGTGGLAGALGTADFTLLGTAQSLLRSLTWAGGNGDWNYTSSNWLDGSTSATFASGNNATINSGGTLTVRPEGVTAAEITVSGANNTTLTGGALTATAISKSGVGALNLNTAGNYSSGVSVTGGTVQATVDSSLSGNVTLNAGTTLDIGTTTNTVANLSATDATINGTGKITTSATAVTQTTGSSTIAADISGAGSFTKAGAGTVTLSGSNSYTGNTIVAGGVLATSGNERISDASVITPGTGAKLLLGGNETVRAVEGAATSAMVDLQNNNLTIGSGSTSNSFSGNIMGAGTVTKIGSGIQTFATNNSFTGGLTLKEGVIRMTGNGDLLTTNGVVTLQSTAIGTGTLTLEGGTLTSSTGGTNLSTTTGRTINNNVVLNGGFSAGRDGEAGRIRFGVQTTTPGTTILTRDSTINANFANVEMHQVVTDGDSDFRITKTGLAKLELTNNNSFAGVTVSQGSLAYAGSKNALGSGTLILNDGAIVGQAGSIGANTDSDRTIGNSIRISGNVTFGTGSASYLGGNIDMDGGNRTLTLANSTHLIGDISNGTGLSVTRQTTDTIASKTLSLYGNNSFTGGTTVSSSADFGVNNPGLNLGSDTALGSGSLTFTGVGTNQVKATTKSESDLTRTIANNIVINNSAVEFGTVSSGYGVTNVSVNMALNGAISGSGALIKTNANTLTLGGANTYAGGTTVNQGALVVNGSVGAVTVNTGGSLGGSGTVGAVTLKSGSLLNPGNSPGTLTASSSIWEAGSSYNWEIDQATGGTAGANWDLFSVTGALDLSALSSTAKMNLVLQSLSSMDDFSPTAEYSWVFAQAGSLVGAGLADGANVTDLFNITATAFNGGVGPVNGFRVEVGTLGGVRTLNLMAVPEPSTGAMLVFGLVGLVGMRVLRRKA